MSESLAGKTILVTRARPQAGVFSAALAELGAKVIEIPTIEIVSAESPELDAAIQSLDRYDWLFFTSANGVTIFFERLNQIIPKSEERCLRSAPLGRQPPRRCDVSDMRSLCNPSSFKLRAS